MRYLLGRFDKKAKAAFKIYDFKTGQQIRAIHKFFNILRIKGNQPIKFGQLIEYKIRNTCHTQNHTDNAAEKLIPGSFRKNQN